MVLILVLLTFVAFIVAARIFFHGREAATEGDSAGEVLRSLPAGPLAARPGPVSYLHPSHVWVRFAPDGMATVGASDFAANFVGALAGMETPETGRVLRQGQPAWTLVSARNRRLTQAMPLDGEVMEVNHALVDGGGGSRSGSHHSDWILRVRPSRLAENVQNLLGGSLADAWQEMAGLKLNAALAPALGRLANDGGVWMENFGDLLDDSDWHALRRDLFPPQQDPAIR